METIVKSEVPLRDKTGQAFYPLTSSDQVILPDGSRLDTAALSGGGTNPNLLDNWYFADPINQRGQTEYKNTAYTIDQWRVTSGGIVQIQKGYTHIDIDGIMSQSDFIRVDKETLVTLSMLVDPSSAYKKSCALQLYCASEHGIKKIDSTFTSFQHILQPNKDYRVRFWGDLNVIAVKLELGSHQTLARQDNTGGWVLNDPPPNKATELLKCQRYYQYYPYVVVAGPGTGWIRIGFSIPTMRIKPTMKVEKLVASNAAALPGSTLQSIDTRPNYVVSAQATPSTSSPICFLMGVELNAEV